MYNEYKGNILICLNFRTKWNNRNNNDIEQICDSENVWS